MRAASRRLALLRPPPLRTAALRAAPPLRRPPPLVAPRRTLLTRSAIPLRVPARAPAPLLAPPRASASAPRALLNAARPLSSGTAAPPPPSAPEPPPPPPARWSPAWIWATAKEMALHYYHGTKLLIADTKIAWRLVGKLARGKTLSRREHNLLVRVLADLARIIPLTFFLVVPFMEFALPFALRLFPNLLPSTFEEKHQIEEKRKNLLKVRLEIAQVMMGTLEERALQLQRQRRAKEREKLAEAAASVPSGGGAAPPKKSAKEADAEEKKRLRDLLWKLREGGVRSRHRHRRCSPSPLTTAHHHPPLCTGGRQPGGAHPGDESLQRLVDARRAPPPAADGVLPGARYISRVMAHALTARALSRRWLGPTPSRL